jgi:diaminopimelate epimerase
MSVDIPSFSFSKLSGAGNDFICVDNRDGRYDPILHSPKVVGDMARYLCRRGISVGADGMIFAGPVGNGDGVDIVARFFEPDGSEVELCGNGVGCFVYWVVRQGWVVAKEEIRVLTNSGVVRGRVTGPRQALVCIPTPSDIALDIPLQVKGEAWTCHYLMTGVPHVVAFVDSLEHFDIYHWGPAFRYHPRFGPRGVNANFVQVIAPGRIAVRTYEFGVENETLACGTGSSSAAIITAIKQGWSKKFTSGDEPVLVDVFRGDQLKVYFTLQENNEPADVCLETLVRIVYHADLDPDTLQRALAR